MAKLTIKKQKKLHLQRKKSLVRLTLGRYLSDLTIDNNFQFVREQSLIK